MMYDEEEPRKRRRSIVPILMIVAGLLAVAVAAAGVLYFTGVLGNGAALTASSETEEPADLSPDTPPPTDLAAADGEPDRVQPDTPEDTNVPDAVVSVAPPAQGEPPVRSTHGDWQIRCDTPAGAQSEQCVLMQFVTAEDRENVGLTVIVLKTADKKARIMRIVAPLGVLLPSGLGLKIDTTDMGRAGFVRCLPTGCVAEVILEDALLSKLEAGKTATFIIFQTPEEGIGIPISLNGFGPGFGSLP
jgi:invasion protein IalB